MQCFHVGCIRLNDFNCNIDLKKKNTSSAMAPTQFKEKMVPGPSFMNDASECKANTMYCQFLYRDKS